MINYKVNQTNRDFLDANTEPGVAYWLTDGDYFTNSSHLNFLNTVGGFDLDVPTFISSLQGLAENEDIAVNPVNNVLAYFTYKERITQLKTSATDAVYLELVCNVPSEGLYRISYGLNIRYEKRGTQYIKYKVDVDDSINISCPHNNGWVEPEVWNNESNNSKGLDWSNSRAITLTSGSHTIRLRIGRTGSKSVIANFGFLQIEEK